MDTITSKKLLDDYGIPYSLNMASIPNVKNNNFIRTSTEKYSKNISKLETRDQKNDNEKIYVCVRKRPLNSNEIKREDKNAVFIKDNKTVIVHEQKLKLDLTKYINYHHFTFDYAFDSDASNKDVYKQTGASLIEHVFNGGTATYFCYGQTGSGKTFTMMNPEQGLFILAAKDIFTLLKKEKYSFISVYISFYEIYQGQLYDLLNNKKKVYAREDNNQQVCIQGLTEYECFSEDELMTIFINGKNSRVTSTTGSNPDSSRSHGIFQVVLKDKTKKNLPVYGKFIFIDLAGSERGADRDDTDKQTLLEGQEINKSLLALKECIRAIDQESKHTPFRQSKLTQVLKDSFIGNSKTCMITTISPSSMNIDHTLNTLRYAHRVKEFGQEITTSKAIIYDSSTEKGNKIKINIIKKSDDSNTNNNRQNSSNNLNNSNSLNNSKSQNNNNQHSNTNQNNNNNLNGSNNLNNNNNNSNSNNGNGTDKKKNSFFKYSKLPTYQYYGGSKKKVLNQPRKAQTPTLPPISKSDNDDDNFEYNKKIDIENNGNIHNNLNKSTSRTNSPTKPHILRRKIFSSGDINLNSMIPTINKKNGKNNYSKNNKNLNNLNKNDTNSDNLEIETIKAFSERLYSFSELKELENSLFTNIKKRFEIDSDKDIPLKLSSHESFLIFNDLINNTDLILEKKMKLIKEIKAQLKSKSYI